MLQFGVALFGGGELWIEKMVRYQYSFNEVVILKTICFQFWFSEYVTDFETRTALGKAFIALVITAVVVNFAFAVYQIVESVQKRVKRYRERKARMKKKLEESQNATQGPLLRTHGIIGCDESNNATKNLENWLDNPLM